LNLLDVFMDGAERDARDLRIGGVVVGIVTNNQDPDEMGRVKVKFPWLSDEDESNWARVATPMAGKDRGLYLLPEVEDEVLVAFENGDMRFPYVLGSLWNGNTPPAKNDDGKNNVRVLKSRSGHVIRLTDEDGKEKIEIIDKSEKNSIEIDTASNTITITADKDIVLSASNGKIKLDAQNIELSTSADIKHNSGAGMEIKASGQLKIKGATVEIN
jgi:uncharacterized protein involved in type VI secretion and phage assembly